MIGRGRIIDDDMLGVARRLKSIDDGYFIFRNYVSGRFEVHNRKCAPNTLCILLPFDTLDERTVNRVLYTRAERVESIVNDLERDNERYEREMRYAAMRKVEAAIG